MTAWMNSFHFLRPLWLLIIPFALLIYFLHSFREDIRARWKRVIAPELLEHLIVKRSGRWTIRPIHMVCLALVLSSLALAGPAWRREKPPFAEDKAPLVIALDLSQTMDAIDLDPTRLERAKLKVRDLLAARSGARTALFVYAGSSHLVVPLTTDDKLFAMYLDALSTALMPKPGKDTSQVLAAIQDLLHQEEVPGSVLFITDGVEPSAQQALQKFIQAGKDSVLVLGVGTSQGAPIRVAGNRFFEDAAGRRIFAKLDVDSLKSLSNLGASVSTLTVDDSDIRWIQRRVQNHLKATEENDAQMRWMDEGYWLVLPICLLAALWFRKGWTVQWSRGAVALLLLSPQPLLVDAHHWFLDLWLTPDQQGRYYFQKGEYKVAAERFQNSMWKGIALCRTGDYAAALDHFANADSAEAWYNQGNALAHLHRYPEAVHAYEQALQTKPDWQDAQDNLKLVRSLIPPPKKSDAQQEEAPNQEPGETQLEDKDDSGKKGTQRFQMNSEKMVDIWMRNIQTSPAEFLRRRFAIQAVEAGKP